MIAPFLENDNIYYGLTGQLYEVMEGDVLDYLTPAQQHQYRQDGYITAPSYNRAVGVNYKPSCYCDIDHGDYNDYVREVRERKAWLRLYGDSYSFQKDPFDDDDWDKPLYSQQTLKEAAPINQEVEELYDDFDKPQEVRVKEHVKDNLTPLPCKIQKMSARQCKEWLEVNEEGRHTEFELMRITAVKLRMNSIIAYKAQRKQYSKEELEQRNKAFAQFAYSIRQYGATTEECEKLFEMMLHQDEWWASKQIKYNTLIKPQNYYE